MASQVPGLIGSREPPEAFQQQNGRDQLSHDSHLASECSSRDQPYEAGDLIILAYGPRAAKGSKRGAISTLFQTCPPVILGSQVSQSQHRNGVNGLLPQRVLLPCPISQSGICLSLCPASLPPLGLKDPLQAGPCCCLHYCLGPGAAYGPSDSPGSSLRLPDSTLLGEPSGSECLLWEHPETGHPVPWVSDLDTTIVTKADLGSRRPASPAYSRFYSSLPQAAVTTPAPPGLALKGRAVDDQRTVKVAAHGLKEHPVQAKGQCKGREGRHLRV